MDMILRVFPSVGNKLSIQDAYLQLANLAGGPNAMQRAAGSLGGSSRWGTIVLRNGSYYERVR